MKPPYIHILWNDLSRAEGCPLCGQRHHDAMIGLWLFVSGLDDEPLRICWPCGDDLAPELLDIVVDFNSNEAKFRMGLGRKQNSRFDEMFEDIRYMRVILTEFPTEKIQSALIREIMKMLNNR